jgi:uncharacterized radical SAM superfamily protein
VSTDDVVGQFQRALALDAQRWRAAWQARLQHHPATIRFDRPFKTLPVSLTGTSCALNCAHCGGVYLRHMQPIGEAPLKAEADGFTSCLISGGCDARGRVPFAGHLDEVARLRHGRRLNWHVGMMGEEELRTILPYVDVISFDLVGDAETAREVYGLNLTLEDYLRQLDMLERHTRVVPHLTIGLRGGRLSGEWAALEALSPRAPETLILLILIPTPGTAYAHCVPPALAEVADLFLRARILLPTTRLYLGCMRPRGAYRQAVDELAVRAGLNGLVNPSRSAERAAQELGLEIIWGEECCALG